MIDIVKKMRSKWDPQINLPDKMIAQPQLLRDFENLLKWAETAEKVVEAVRKYQQSGLTGTFSNVDIALAAHDKIVK